MKTRSFKAPGFSAHIGLVLLLVMLHALALAQELDPLAQPALPPGEEPVLPSPRTLLGALARRLFTEPTLLPPNNFIDATYRLIERWKQEHHIPITIGAHNWFHVDNAGPYTTGYGIPGLNGTYFYYLLADPILPFGPLAGKVGTHLEVRFRDGNTPFRAFFPDKHAWFYEAYGWVDTPGGRLKGGAIWQRFGIDWDGSWWGNLQYLHGFKLNPNLGFSWERVPSPGQPFKLDSFVQFFVTEDNVNGVIVGADQKSVIGSTQQTTLNVRLVPTWSFPDRSSLAMGLSGFVGEIVNDALIHVIGQQPVQPPAGRKEAIGAWAFDLTYAHGGLKLFGEVLQQYGTLSPSNYASGGPSNRQTLLLAGLNYKLGPVTYTFSYSGDFLENPVGTEHMWVPGFVVALTQNVDFYMNYVLWKDRKTDAPGFATLENGFQLVFNWRY